MRVVKWWMVISLLTASAPALAQSPILPIQGTLREMAGNLVNDTRGVTFRLYNNESGGTPFYTATKNVSFTNGQFVAYLGDQGDDPLEPTDFDGLPQVWLGIEVSPETVEMTPRARVGTSPFALYAELCGEAQSAVQAQTAVTATTANSANSANDLNCSGCVGQTQLDTATRNQIDAPADDVSCSGCVDGTDVNPAAFRILRYNVTDVRFNEKCFGPVNATFCALSQVTRREISDPASGINRYCLVKESSPGRWEVCGRGGTSTTSISTMTCQMICFSLQ